MPIQRNVEHHSAVATLYCGVLLHKVEEVQTYFTKTTRQDLIEAEKLIMRQTHDMIYCNRPCITPGVIFEVGYIRGGLYTGGSDIGGQILQKISKGLYFKHNIVKKLIARRFH